MPQIRERHLAALAQILDQIKAAIKRADALGFRFFLHLTFGPPDGLKSSAAYRIRQY